MNDRKLHPSFTLAESDNPYFDKVPAESLTLIHLLHYEKMNYREIAQQTGLAVGTVASRIHRGRQIIRKLRAEDEARNETWQEATLA